MTRTTITFDSHGQKCAGWFYPAAADGRAACVVMAPGLAAVKEMRLDAYAERFADAGYNVLVFDYRHFGASDGRPRQLLDIRRQHEDWISAASYARSRAEVDPNRIALWGTSLSGGHVLAVADDVGAAAVISQVPHTDGPASVLALGPAQALNLTGHAIYDAARDLLGRSPHYLPASGEPGTTALMTAPEAADYLRLVPEGYDFDQRVAARFALAHRPLLARAQGQASRRSRAGPGRAPRRDHALEGRNQGRQSRAPGTVSVYDAGHFEPYTGEMFDTFVTEQIAFLRNNLKTKDDTEMSRTIVITGAGAGIGREAARKFAQRGWTVCATDLNHQALEALESELGPRHTYAKMDVTDKADVDAVFADFAGRHGGAFDALLNNAGVAFIQNFEEQTLEQHELVAKVNINGVLNCTYLAFPYLAKGRDAKLINMCSLSSEYGIPSEATYSASKSFVRGFTEAMNIEWERHGIHVCDVLPNFVATPMMDAAHGNIVDSIGVNLTADDVADTIAKAADDRSKVHWVVDTAKLKVVRVLMNNSPAPLRRAAIKKFAGF